MNKKTRTKPVKLIELIRTLDRKEFNGFGRYIYSMVKDENVHKLFAEIKKFAPKFEIGQKEREKIFFKIFNITAYDNRQMNYLTSAMNIHLEEYLVMIAIRQNQKQKDYMLMEYYKSRDQFDFFKRTADFIMEREDEKPVKDGEYYLTKMKIEYDLYHYAEENDAKRIGRQAERIESMSHSLDEFYMYYKLNLVSDLTTFGADFNVDKDIKLFLEEIKATISSHPIYENNLIQIYLFIIDNFEEHSSENYLSLKKKILDIIEDVSDEHQKNLFSCLSNYAMNCNASGIPGFRNYMFEIFQMGIDNGYVMKNGEFSYQYFINAILMATGVGINQTEWARNTIKNKGHLINKNMREDSLLLVNAYVDFVDKKYDKALQKLNRVEQWRHYSFGIQGRLLTLKCYYELDIETDGDYLVTTEYFADSYKNYLKRNKIFSDSINKSIINLITFTIKIMRNRYSKKYTAKELHQELKKYEPLVAKPWVLEIIDTHLQRKKKTA